MYTSLSVKPHLFILTGPISRGRLIDRRGNHYRVPLISVTIKERGHHMSSKREQILKAAANVLNAEMAFRDAVDDFDKLLPKEEPSTPTPDLHKELADEQCKGRPSAPTNSLDPHSPKGKIMMQLNSQPRRIFNPADFAKRKSNKLTMPQIYNALSSLTRQGHIERVAPGAYKLMLQKEIAQ